MSGVSSPELLPLGPSPAPSGSPSLLPLKRSSHLSLRVPTCPSLFLSVSEGRPVLEPPVAPCGPCLQEAPTPRGMLSLPPRAVCVVRSSWWVFHS